MSGRFAGRIKDWYKDKAFMSCDDEILDALAMLGNDNDLPSDACSQLERFVCVLYSLVPLLKSCSRRRKPSTNFWFTGLTYSACTLHSHDLSKTIEFLLLPKKLNEITNEPRLIIQRLQ